MQHESDYPVVELLGDLVAANSENPPGHERAAADLLVTALANLGCEVELDEFQPGRANVVARYENGPGPVVALNSHIDVVPAGHGWQRDAFTPVVENGRLYGRGACDAKGPIAAMVAAIARLIAAPQGWQGELLAVFVADEEVGSMGARHFVGQLGERTIDYAVVGEPTGNAPIVAHKGSMRPIVRVHGRSAHSGSPDDGINALYGAARVLGLVEAAHRDLATPPHPLLGRPSLTVTRTNGGHADNVVPDRCDLMLDRRMVPGEDEAAVVREIEALLDIAKRDFGVDAEIVAQQPTTGGASETDREHPVVAAALAATRRITCRPNLDVGGFQGGCDLVHFRGVGAHGVVVGPGSLAVAHQPDEFVPLDELHDAIDIYVDIVQRLLPPSRG